MSLSKSPRELVDKSRYLIPNLITLTGLGFGLGAIFMVMRGLNAKDAAGALSAYNGAAWCVMLCTIFDKLDGTSARFFNAMSNFGVELDSFSDFIAFGVAPASIVYGLMIDRRLDFVPADEDLIYFYVGIILFVFATALRLARFNVTTTPGSSFMKGLPTTAAGSFLSAYILTGLLYMPNIPFFKAWIMFSPYVMIILAVMMVSNVKLPKVAKRRSKAFNAFQVVTFLAICVLIILRKRPDVLLAIGSASLLGGFGYCIIFREKIEKQIAEEIKKGEPQPGD